MEPNAWGFPRKFLYTNRLRIGHHFVVFEKSQIFKTYDKELIIEWNWIE